jgi:hypothetical protein
VIIIIYKDIKYISKHYSWGYTVWISINGIKKMLGSKIPNKTEVNKLINNIKLG